MLTTEQLAVQAILRKAVENGVRTVCIPGNPGTGRFALLRELAAEQEAVGKTCTFLAPTSKAAALLRLRGRCDAKSIHAFVTEVAKGETPVQDMLVITQAEILDAIVGGPTPDDLYAALLKTCKTLVIAVAPCGLYSVVSSPAFEENGMCITRSLVQAARQP